MGEAKPGLRRDSEGLTVIRFQCSCPRPRVLAHGGPVVFQMTIFMFSFWSIGF